MEVKQDTSEARMFENYEKEVTTEEELRAVDHDDVSRCVP